MVPFSDWGLALQFALIFSVIIIVPCIIVTIMGRKMIDKLGQRPSRAALIHMSVFWYFLIIEIITFCLLIAFYKYFAGQASP